MKIKQRKRYVVVSVLNNQVLGNLSIKDVNVVERVFKDFNLPYYVGSIFVYVDELEMKKNCFRSDTNGKRNFLSKDLSI